MFAKDKAIEVSANLVGPIFVIGRGELVPITKTVVIEDRVSSHNKRGNCRRGDYLRMAMIT